MIRNFFKPPVFEKEEDNFRARYVSGFAWWANGLLLVDALTYIVQGIFDATTATLVGLVAVMTTSLYLLKKKYINTSAIILVVFTWVGIGINAYTADGAKDVVFIAFIAISLLASIIINWQAGIVVMLASIGLAWVFTFMEINGDLTPVYQEPITYSTNLTLLFLAVTALIYISTVSLRSAIQRASKSEAELHSSNIELRELNQSLEDRVSNRTAELETANRSNAKRAKQFQAIAQVAHATTTNEPLETLLPRITNLVSKQFDVYHVGIFLLEETRRFAVLRAANSEGGKRMLMRRHQLQVGQIGIVGLVSATGTPRIALDVGSDAVFFDNPDLPNTRSEMALPLLNLGEIIGVLDIQSVEPNAFHEDDIEVLSTLADQIASAIQNARNYENMQDLLDKAQKASGIYLKDAWQGLQAEEANIGYRVTSNEITRLNRALSSKNIKKAVENQQTIMENGKNATLAIPIRLKNEVIGIMDIRTPLEHEWDEDEVDIAEAVAERLSLALETSLLIRSTQRRAEMERITADIAGKIGATSQFDSILRTAAEELSRVFGGSEVLVQMHAEKFEAES